jgi:hypothetical protein
VPLLSLRPPPLKNKTRSLVLGNRVLNEGTPTVVASFGRAGSSLMTESCVRSLAKNSAMYGALDRLVGLDHLPAWDLGEVRPVNWVYKTHAFFDPVLPLETKSVYIFTGLSRSVASHIRMLREAEPDWRTAHLDHFGLSRMPALDALSIFRAFDVAGRFNSWFAQSTHAVAFVRLDGLWQAQEKLSAFLGYEVGIVEPPRTYAGRPADVPDDEAYRGFAEFLDGLPPFFTRNA